MSWSILVISTGIAVGVISLIALWKKCPALDYCSHRVSSLYYRLVCRDYRRWKKCGTHLRSRERELRTPIEWRREEQVR